MRIVGFVAAAAFGLAAPLSAQADTLSLTLTADNAFSVYVSTNDSQIGTLVGTNLGLDAGQWAQSFSYNFNLNTSDSSSYYIHVIGTNYNSANGRWGSPGTLNGGGDNPDAFLGQFSIGGTDGYVFAANATASLLTNSNPGQWRGIDALNDTSWTLPTNGVQDFGTNGGSNIWSAVHGVVTPISTSAYWIWSLPDNGGYADFSTKIMLASSDVVPPTTPVPAALPLFATGLGALGLMGWRRKRKAATSAASLAT
jgi:hypothetical protein